VEKATLMALITRLLRTAASTLNSLTRPHHQIADAVSQQNAQLLSWILLVTILVVSLIVILVVSFDPDDLDDVRTYVAFSVIITAFVLYLVNRRGYVRWATLAFIAFITIIFISTAYVGHFWEFIPFVMVPLLLVAIFYSFKTTVAFLAIVVVMTIILNSVYIDENIWSRRILGYFLLLAGGLILVFKHHLTALENIRQKRLEEDNAEREQQRLQLALEKERGETFRMLMGNIAHDIKTPLTIISTSLYLLEKHKDPLKRQEKVDSIKGQVQVLGNFIQDLMLIARLEAEPQLHLTSVDINELIMSIEADYSDIIEKKHLQFTLDLEAAIPLIQADQADLRRALTNLIENGINYTQEGGVTVKTEQQAQAVLVEVADTGTGIDKAALPHIFDRFYRSIEAKTLIASGSGIGLAIVKRVVEMHGGTVEVESVLSKGTTFKVMLPFQN
jgi:signal transduction histidine kinase